MMFGFFSPLLYYWRNKGKSIPILVILAFSVLAVSSMTNIVNTIVETSIVNFAAYKQMMVVAPKKTVALPVDIVTKVQRETEVMIYPVILFSIPVKMIAGTGGFDCFGLNREGIEQIMALYQVRLLEGRLPNPGKNEIVLARDIARARDMKIGDQMGTAVNEDDWVPGEFVLVGELSSDIRLCFSSYEFLQENPLYVSLPKGLLLITKTTQQESLADSLSKSLPAGTVNLITYSSLLNKMRESSASLYLLLGIVDALVIIAVSLSIGVLHYLFFLGRVREFGILSCLGFRRQELIQRVLFEIFLLISIGWLIGMLWTVSLFSYLSYSIFSPRGISLNPWQPSVLAFAAPLVIAATIFGISPIAWRLSRMDPVTIIEYRES